MKKLLYATLATTGVVGTSVGIVELNKNHHNIQPQHEYIKKYGVKKEFQKSHSGSLDKTSFFSLDQAIKSVALNIMYKRTVINADHRPYIYYFSGPEKDWQEYNTANRVLPSNLSQHIGFLYDGKIYKQAHLPTWNVQPKNNNNQILKEAYERLQFMINTGISEDIARKSFEILLANKTGSEDIASSPFANIPPLSIAEIGKLLANTNSYSAFEQAKKDHPDWSLEEAIASNGQHCSTVPAEVSVCWTPVWLNKEYNSMFDSNNIYSEIAIPEQYKTINDLNNIKKIYSFEKLYNNNNELISSSTGSTNNFIWTKMPELVSYINKNWNKFIEIVWSGLGWDAIKNDFNH